MRADADGRRVPRRDRDQLVIGFVNGWFVTRLNIPSFLVTLGMLLVVRGTALVYLTDGFPQRPGAEGNGLPMCWSASS
jgi:ribose/xylose/arabinose/galactoside ABC-type transport system permease subunit